MTDITQKTKPSIFVAVPSSRDWKVEFAMSMLSLASHLTEQCCNGELSGLQMRCQVNSLLPMGRQTLLNQALESGATHMLWIDDDTKFPVQAIDVLLSRDLDYVAGNVCRKQFPLSPTAQDEHGNVIDSTGKTGVQEASWLGLAFCLIRLDAIRSTSAPHFEVLYIPDENKYVGEDMYFCEKMREIGVKMYIDHDVSQRLGHIGDFSYEYPKQRQDYQKRNKEAA